MFTLEEFKSKLRRRRQEATGKIRARAEVIRQALVASGLRVTGMVSLAKWIGARNRAGKYQDALIRGGMRRASEAMGPYLKALGDEVASADSLKGVRSALLRRYRTGAKGSRSLALVLARSAVVSKLAGMDEAHRTIE